MPVFHSRRGYTLLEVVIAMAIFGIFLFVLTVLTTEMHGYERRLPVNFMRHPQLSHVLSKLRRDVQDAHGSRPYPPNHAEFRQSPQTLIIESVQQDGSIETVIWDFREPGEVQRISFRVGVRTVWRARGLPKELMSNFAVDAVGIPGRPWGVRVKALDGKGLVAIDQILQPRAHE